MIRTILLAIAFIYFAGAQTGGVFEKAVGPCINDKCPTNNTCYYGQCIPSDIAPEMPVPDNSTALGPCKYGGLCGFTEYCYKGQCFPHPKDMKP